MYIDLRNGLPPARSQGRRPTCVSFAVSAGHAFARMISGVFVPLSEEMVDWGARMKGGGGPEGVTMGSVDQALSQYGHCTLGLWPYDAGHLTAPQSALVDGGTRLARMIRHDASSSAVRNLLLAREPVVILTPVTKQFSSPNAGLIPTPVAADVLHDMHAMLCVGWVEHAEHGEVFVLRNSWGDRWGDRGYGYCYADFLDQIASYAYTIQAA